MDPELIDLIWTLHKQLGSNEPVKLISGLPFGDHQRLAAGARAAARPRTASTSTARPPTSSFPDVPVKTLRNSALVQEWGGVGYYPTSGIPFVHVDTGRVRMWPRIPRLELAALFPSGKTKYLPADGKPITPQDYKLAMAKGLPGRNTLLASVRPAPKPKPRPRFRPQPTSPLSSLCSGMSSSLRYRTSRSRRKRCSPPTCPMLPSPPLP